MKKLMSKLCISDKCVVNILYNIIVLKPFIFFYIIYGYVSMTVTCVTIVTVTCNIILISNPKSQIIIK